MICWEALDLIAVAIIRPRQGSCAFPGLYYTCSQQYRRFREANLLITLCIVSYIYLCATSTSHKTYKLYTLYSLSEITFLCVSANLLNKYI
jgi:hypothetical protein